MTLILSNPKTGEKKHFFVHVLVLITFVGPCPKGKEARHFPNRNPSNNNLSNLSWATKKRNQRDKVYHGTDSKGEKSWNAVFSNKMADRIRLLYSKKGNRQNGRRHSHKSLSVRFGVSKSAIERIVKGKTYL